MRIKKGDIVEIIAGKDKGKRGSVMRSLPSKGKVVVEGLNIVKRAKKPTRYGQQGQLVDMPQPLDISNVMLVCPNCEKPTRISYSQDSSVKERVCKKCQTTF